MAIKKEERIRQEAMDYAYKIAKTEGLEALEKRCRRNAETYAPSGLTDAVNEYYLKQCKESAVFTFLSSTLMVLHDKLDISEEQLGVFVKEFIELSDAIYYKWLTFKDIVETLKEEANIDISEYAPLAYAINNKIDERLEHENYQPGTL